jgi:hypothetical protein
MEVFTNWTAGSMSWFLKRLLSKYLTIPYRETRAYAVRNPEMYLKYACDNSSVRSMQSSDARSDSGFHTLSSGFRFNEILSVIPESCGSTI